MSEVYESDTLILNETYKQHIPYSDNKSSFSITGYTKDTGFYSTRRHFSDRTNHAY